MMNNEDILHEKLEKISTKNDFISFLKEYVIYIKDNKSLLENQTIEDFLESMIGFTGSSENYYKNFNIDSEKLSKWKIFADILMASSVYE